MADGIFKKLIALKNLLYGEWYFQKINHLQEFALWLMVIHAILLLWLKECVSVIWYLLQDPACSAGEAEGRHNLRVGDEDRAT